jgi:hypothetical protein
MARPTKSHQVFETVVATLRERLAVVDLCGRCGLAVLLTLFA